MKALNFNFAHPVKGKIRLVNKVNPEHNRVLPLNAASDETIAIPIDDLSAGRWRVTLEWDYDDRNFFFQEDFEV